MGQGIYWVQRERSGGRSRASRELQAMQFNNRYNRITQQFLSIFRPYTGPSGQIDVPAGSKLDTAMDRYNDLKMFIDNNVDNATNADLSKLATAAKNILIEIGKREGWSLQWDPRERRLIVNGQALDFS